MQEVELSDPSALGLALDVLRSANPVFLLRMPAVYALVAPPTVRGARALDAVKQRLPGKTDGSMIGARAAFRGRAAPAAHPPAFAEADALSCFEDAVVRLRLQGPPNSTAVVRDGSHQGLLFGAGAHRDFALGLEAGLTDAREPELFGGSVYTVALCTSANLSGDPQGSIVDESRAAAFAQERGVQRWVRAPEGEGVPGSYPVFSLSSDGCTVERDGPGRARIERRVQELLG